MMEIACLAGRPGADESASGPGRRLRTAAPSRGVQSMAGEDRAYEWEVGAADIGGDFGTLTAR